MVLNRFLSRLKKKSIRIQEYILLSYYKRQKIAVIMIDGGLGSQIFKYAFGLTVEKKMGLKVYYDLSWFQNVGKSIDGKSNRVYQLEMVFPSVKLRHSNKNQTEILKKYFLHQNATPHLYSDLIFSGNGPVYFNGYYANVKYFSYAESTLRNRLNFAVFIKRAAGDFLNIINKTENNIAVHVRRGDYVNSMHDTLTPEYYKSAINKLKEYAGVNPTLFFFSNDIPWVKEKIIPLLSCDTVSYFYNGTNDSGYIDMYLLSNFKYIVISNSEFSWVPAWLSEISEKKIILPKKWFNTNDALLLSGIETALNIEGSLILEMDGNESANFYNSSNI